MDIRPSALFDALVLDLSNQLPEVESRYLSIPGIQGASPYPGMSGSQFASLALLKSIFKKFEDLTESERAAADDAALKKFLAANTKCGEWALEGVLQGWEHMALQTARRLLEGLFNVFEEYEGLMPSGYYPLLDINRIVDGLDSGPGASIGASGESLYHKFFAGPLSSTHEGLYLLFLQKLESQSLWTEAELRRIEEFGGCQLVPGSRLGFSPKSPTCSRVTCTEPNLNMMFQKGIDKLLRPQLERCWGINLKTQETKNQELARLGSLYGTYATIDLTSASDTISRKVVKWLLPKRAVSVLNWCRSERTQLPSGAWVDLHMLSSMGNGYTFSLETVIFTAVVLSAYEVLGIPVVFPHGRSLGNFGVYGDDMVVVTEAYGLVSRLLTLLGFEVNSSKSFHDGNFRESCGSDWYYGQNVRGVYCNHLRRAADRYSLLNRLVDWTARTGLVLERTCRLLLKGVNQNLVVPRWEQDIAGIKVPFDLIPRLKSSPFVQAREGSRFSGYQSTFLYYKLAARPTVIRLSTEDEQLEAAFGVGLFLNDPGLLLAASSGSMVGGGLTLRQHGPSRVTKTLGVAPSWDGSRLRPDKMGCAVSASHALVRDPDWDLLPWNEAAEADLVSLLRK